MFRKIFSFIIAPLDFITRYFKALIFLLIVILIISATLKTDMNLNPPNLGKIHLQNVILSSESVRSQIDKIIENPTIKGTLLIIDSPGGSVSASIEIADMIAELKEKMPVVAYVEGVMASGSYYAGMYANKIYANRGTLIGSIGVIFSGANIEELLQKIGIKSQEIAIGKYKEVGTFTRKWTLDEKNFLHDLLQESYATFVSDVAKTRQLDIKSSKEYAEGKVFSAKKALELKLIDKIGTRNEAILELKNLAKVENPVWLEKDKFEALFDKIIQSSMQAMLQAFHFQLY